MLKKKSKPATFGERLAYARKAAGLTQRQLAKRAEINYSQISRYEQDLSMPRPSGFLSLCKVLMVPLEWLREGHSPEDEQDDGLDPEADPLDLDPDLFAFVLDECAKSGRTFQQEINAMLRESYERDMAAQAKESG